jgi:uncharacterized membrane protein
METLTHLVELVAIVLAALVVGVFWGPWLALSRSMATFEAAVFLAIVHRMNRNLATPMTVLMPLGLASIVAVMFLTYSSGGSGGSGGYGGSDGYGGFWLASAALALFLVALLVTVLVEVPIVKTIATWTVETLPDDWRRHRDRWVSFHVVRVVTGVAGLTCLAAAAIF